MTEAHWAESEDLFGMLERALVRTSERKLRLFGCACVREVGYLLSERRAREAFYVAERFADDLATAEELAAAHAEADAAYRNLFRGKGPPAALGARALAKVAAVHEALCQATNPRFRAEGLARATANALLGGGGDLAWRAQARRVACDQLRDIFGNPFRRPRLDANWLRKRGGTAVQIARIIYAERTFDELPVLADALEDADCPNEELVKHCQGGEHGRGCWVIDALLGKK